MWRALAGTDGPGRTALPAGEFLRPVPLAALLCLAVNDHLLKGASILPAVVTGKLSDFAGLLMFPLLMTAVLDSGTWALCRITGLAGDFSLSRGKLGGAIAITGGLFAAIKLSRPAADGAAAALSAVGLPSQIVADPTDLIALPCLWLAWIIGCREIRRVPLGRLAVIEIRWRRHGSTDVARALADVAQCGSHPEDVRQLARGLEGFLRGGTAESAERALRALRR